MNVDLPRHAASGPDEARPDSTTNDSRFTLSIEDALARYVEAGLPRTARSIQRYCALNHLDCRRVDTAIGQKWLVDPNSIERHIAYIREVTPPTSRDLSGPVATSRVVDEASPSLRENPNTSDTIARHAATGRDTSRLVEPNDENNGLKLTDQLRSENGFLRDQIAVKDEQIKDLTERAKETNHLIAGLQRMLSPLLSSPRRDDGDATRRGESLS